MTDRPLSVTLPPTIGDADALPIGQETTPLPAGSPLDQIARAATHGDVEAIGRLYDELVGPVYRYIVGRVRRREDAEDLTHLVFERIVGALPRYRHDGKPFAAWAFRIARNAVIDHQRRSRQTEPLGVIRESPDGGASLDAISLREEELRELRAAIRRLTPDQREALRLRYAGGLSADEAAQVMGRRAGTIRGLTFRAIEALRRQLGGPMPWPDASTEAERPPRPERSGRPGRSGHPGDVPEATAP
jgi:RNA polymerase sigma-70 factor (ECF subfamily)